MQTHIALAVLLGACPAAHDRRIKLEAFFADELTAGVAPAEVLSLKALERGFKCANAAIPACIQGCGHGLLLHGVHPAEPTHALLVQFDGLAMLDGGAGSLVQFV
nr:hypothetical protein [Pseudotabrizicola sediminis]